MRGMKGQKNIARGKASGRTPLALPRENIPFIFSGLRRIRRKVECRRCSLRRGVKTCG
jgi:hypothetical protein